MKLMSCFRAMMLVMLAMTVAGMTAAEVDSRTAQAKAVQFMNTQPGTRFMASPATMKLAHAEPSSISPKSSVFYVFNYDGGGFVIVAGDDRAEDILGYGDNTLDMNNIPSNMRWWLSQYKEQIEFLFKNPKLQVEKTAKSSTMLTASTVAPLLSCIWDQEAPFYNQCPTRNGSRCLTGCVATAMAQVMYYWKYPAQAPALPAYTTTTRRISMPALPGTTLDWNNMIDDYTGSYTTAQGNAVATLMLYCGQSCYMDYDTYSAGGSGAYTDDQLTGMKAFGYNSGATYVRRSSYTDSQWTAMMLEDLQAGRPILYGGDDGTYGHAFVVDGYNASTNKYHINWGWSGIDNNYFAISSFYIDSDYDFRQNQDMLYQIYPEGEVIETYAPVMAQASNVSNTSFLATWTDETPSENVQDYTLYVQQNDPNTAILLSETFAGVTVSDDGTSNIANSLNNYCDNQGWTGSYIYQGAGGTLKLGSGNYAGTLTTPALDLSACDGTITVKFKAQYYGSDNSSVVISCGNVTQTVALTSTASDYAVELNGVTAAANQSVTFAGTAKKKRFYIDNIQIISGKSNQGELLTFTGITSKNYTVTGLAEGATYNFYVEANYTDGTKKQSNVETVTLQGTLAPTPEIIVDPETLTMTSSIGQTATATFTVMATDLTGNVTLTLNDANGVYSINPATLSKADAEQGAEVTVTYAPTATGTHDATITVSSESAEDATVTINGTATIQTVAPVMAAAASVGTTSFTATWTDATAAQNVKDYTLYVNKEGAIGDALLTETFAGVSVPTQDGTADCGTKMDTYCDNPGWTGYAAYEAVTGGFKLGSGSKLGYITTPELAENNGTLVVTFNANSYVGTTGKSDESSIVISCGDVSQTIALSDDATDYTVTLAGVPSAAGQKVTLSCAAIGKRVYVHNVTIYNGGANMLKASETGDANSRVITGITDKSYTVENLTAGASYSFYVVANYVDNSNAASNVEHVTLAEQVVPVIVVDNETMTLTASVGETVTATFGLQADNLTGDLTLTLNDENGVYSINPETVSVADAQEGVTVTVTYAPTTTGEHTATITIATEGGEDVTVTLNGTATMETAAPVMLPADEEYVTSSAFRADWTDETPAQFVTDYTLYVNIKQDQPAGLLLNETFYSEDVPSSDSNIDLGANNALDENCDIDGWTGSAVYLAAGGGMKLGSGSKIGYLTTPALDLTGSNGVVTVKFNARSYGSDGSSVVISCGDVSETVVLTTEDADYTVVLNDVTAGEGQTITLSCEAVKKRFYLNSVQVYSGVMNQLKAVNETGDANSRIITGITDKYYVVEGLTAGETYSYYVEANYIDGTKATSNIETVTLLDEQGHGYMLGDVNHDGKRSIGDVTALINYLLSGSADDACVICADVNSDGKISIGDVTELINMLLTSNN